MITYKLLAALFAVVETILAPIKSITLPTIDITGIASYIRLAGQFVPMPTVLTILTFLIGLLSIRTTITLVKTVQQVIPFT